jgi:phosphoesterase RecJ-like protein
MGKRAVCYTDGPLHESHRSLPGIEAMRVGDVTPLPEAARADVTFLLDCNYPDRVAEGFAPPGRTVCVDHHEPSLVDPSDARAWRADVNYADPRASSTAELIFELVGALEVPIDADIATCLYAGILTDTGSFRYSNTTPRALSVAARLVELGADPEAIAQACYESRDPKSLLLIGAALKDLRFERGGRLVWGEITTAMYEAVGGSDSDPEDLIAEMRAARGVEIALLLRQTATGARVSFRAKGDAAVHTLAERLGGGGHRKASGADLTGDYAAIRERALAVAREALP